MAEEKEVSQPPETEIWWSRYEAVGRAQGRYLYILVVACVFYGIVWHETVRDQLSTEVHHASVEIPILQFTLESLPLLRTAPLVLGLCLLAVLGSMQACAQAADRLEALRPKVLRTAFDKAPNLLDMIMYPGSRPGRTAIALTWMSYPALLVAAFLEGTALACVGFTVARRFASPWEVAILLNGTILMMLALPRLVVFVCRRSQRAWLALFPTKPTSSIV